MEIGKKYFIRIENNVQWNELFTSCSLVFRNVELLLYDGRPMDIDTDLVIDFDNVNDYVWLEYEYQGQDQTANLTTTTADTFPIVFIGTLNYVSGNVIPDNLLKTAFSFKTFDDIFYLYQLNTQKNVVTKSDIMYIDVIGGTYKEQIDVVNPSIMIEYNQVPNFNYVYIPSLKRYYFVNKVICVRNNLYQIDLHVDVLYSFDADIRVQSALITRNENVTSSELVDDRLPLSNIPEVTYETLYGQHEIDTELTSADYSVVIFVLNPTIYSTRHTDANPRVSGLPIVSRVTGSNPIMSGYGVTYDEYKHICEELMNVSEYATYVMSAVAFPYMLGDEMYVAGGLQNIVVDNHTLGQGYSILGETSLYHDYADFTITKRFTGTQEFLNYEPYSKYDIYLLYYGWFSLTAKDVVGKNIQVFYVDDLTTGATQIIIYNVTDARILHTLQTQIGCKLSISTSNASDLERQRQASMLNLGIGLIGGVVSTGVGIATANPLGVIGGVLSVSKTIASAVNGELMRVDRASTNVSGDKLGQYTPTNCILRTTYYEPLTITTNVYKHLQGYPINTYDSLSSYTGYTEIGELQYVPATLGYITTNEIDEIVTLARDGIIL